MKTSRPTRGGATTPAALTPTPQTPVGPTADPAPAPAADPTVDPAADPSADPRRWRALGVLAAGLALIVIDGSIVAVSLPTIITDLGLDLTDAQWVSTSYAVVLSALLLTAGRLGDRIGRRRLFLAGVAVFVLASVLAAMAQGAGSLIGARLLQGVGGALILPSTLSTVNATFRGKERAAAFGVWGAVMSGAAALGPLLGGWLTSSFSWPWIFLVNVPVGIAVLVGTIAWVGETREPAAHRAGRLGLDVLGAVLSALALGTLVFAVVESSTLGWWGEEGPLVLGPVTLHGPAGLALTPMLLVIGAVLLAMFLLREHRRAAADREILLDLSLFRMPVFSWGNLTAGAVAIGEFGLLFVLPLYLVNVRALGTLEAGLVLAAMAGGAFLSGALARHLAAAIGAPGTVILGLGLEVLGVGTLALVLRPDTAVLVIVGVLVVYGVGLGLASAQLTSTVLAPVPAEQSGQGSATQSTVRQLGTALGTAIAGAMLAAGLNARTDMLDGRAAGFGESMTESAGSILPQLRAQGAEASVLDQLGTVFTEGTRIAMVGSAGFLLLGLVGAIVVARATSRTR